MYGFFRSTMRCKNISLERYTRPTELLRHIELYVIVERTHTVFNHVHVSYRYVMVGENAEAYRIALFEMSKPTLFVHLNAYVNQITV